MKEPIEHFYNKYGVDKNIIFKIVCGEKYLAVVLKNGKTGVCSTLLNNVKVEIEGVPNIDVSNLEHRVFLTAYYNAMFNNDAVIDSQNDIFDQIDFSQYKNIVMIGFFNSLVKKFNKSGINVNIFDLNDFEGTEDINKINDFLAVADVVVLTSTSVFNNTFLGILENVGAKAMIMMLGPSTIMHKDMFKYNNLDFLFGSIFHENDEELQEIIASGGGTRSFMHRMKKVGIGK